MCERVAMPGGVVAIVCSRGSHRKLGTCQQCYVRPATVLCDGPADPDPTKRHRMPGGDKTCSKPICRQCAVHVQPDADYCKAHAAPESRRLAL